MNKLQNSHGKIAFETARLEAHFLNLQNQHLLFDLYSNPEISLYLQGLDAAKDIELTYSCYHENNNIGAYFIFCRETKALIGFGGVHNQEPLKDGSFAIKDKIEFIIIINAKHGGKGYAKEFSQKFLQMFFEEFPQRKIAARVKKDNTACLKLLENLGFKHEGETIYYDESNKFYLMRVAKV